MKHIKKVAIGAAAALPFMGFAATGNFNNLVDLIRSANGLVNMLIVFVIALATLVFIWGLLTYIISKDAAKQSEAKMYMVWGIIGLFVMVSVWGIVGFLQAALFSGGANTGPQGIPSIEIR